MKKYAKVISFVLVLVILSTSTCFADSWYGHWNSTALDEYIEWSSEKFFDGLEDAVEVCIGDKSIDEVISSNLDYVSELNSTLGALLDEANIDYRINKLTYSDDTPEKRKTDINQFIEKDKETLADLLHGDYGIEAEIIGEFIQDHQAVVESAGAFAVEFQSGIGPLYDTIQDEFLGVINDYDDYLDGDYRHIEYVDFRGTTEEIVATFTDMKATDEALHATMTDIVKKQVNELESVNKSVKSELTHGVLTVVTAASKAWTSMREAFNKIADIFKFNK